MNRRIVHRLSGFANALLDKCASANTWWLIVGSFITVLSLEFATPPDYVFGYLYIGVVLLANSRLSRNATVQITCVAAVLTVANLLVPGWHRVNPPTVANRAIAVLALVVTGILSDRNRRYEEAIAQQEAKLKSQTQLASVREDFTFTLTHDLKTPLLGAIETTNSLQQGKFGDITAAQERVLEIMARSYRKTIQMVQTLLDVYHYDNNGLELRLAAVSLVDIAKETIATLKDLAASRQVEIQLRIKASQSTLKVNGDVLQLQRVFTNLLINAINHTVRGGDVIIKLEREPVFPSDPQPPACIVSAIDEGSGIAVAELPHTFERFYQGQGDRQALGSGLGLYLTRQIVEAHGGTVWAENRLPRGAVFSFRIPTSYIQQVS